VRDPEKNVGNIQGEGDLRRNPPTSPAAGGGFEGVARSANRSGVIDRCQRAARSGRRWLRKGQDLQMGRKALVKRGLQRRKLKKKGGGRREDQQIKRRLTNSRGQRIRKRGLYAEGESGGETPTQHKQYKKGGNGEGRQRGLISEQIPPGECEGGGGMVKWI